MNHLVLTGQPLLLFLSLLISIYGCYWFFMLGGRRTAAEARARFAWHAGAALTLGIGMWSTHSVAMLALKIPFAVSYDLRWVLLSALVSVATSSLALEIISFRIQSRIRKAGAGLCIGFGFVCMEFVGSAALRMPARPSYDAAVFFLSVIVASLVSWASVTAAFRASAAASPSPWIRAAAACAMGTALFVSHEAILGSTSFFAQAGNESDSPLNVQSTGLGFLIGMAVLLLVGISLAYYFVEKIWTVELKRRLEKEKRIESLFQHSQDAVFSFDLDGRLVDVNPAAARLTGYDRRELLGMPTQLLVLPEYLTATRMHFQSAVEGFSPNFDSAILDGNGTRIEVNNTNVPVILEDKVIGVYTIVRDITERKRAERTMEHIAHHDSLTGLPNRRLFERRVTDALASGDDARLAILFLDVDRFKYVNDSLGHDYGDELLQAATDRLRSCLQEGELLSRLGGDEFAILVTGPSARTRAGVLADRMVERLDKPFWLRGHEVHITLSAGIASYPEDGDSLVGLMKNADIALYSSKDNGKNGYTYYARSMNDRMTEMMKLEIDLRKALQRSEFFLVYQPQIDIVTGKMVGVEALLRWNHGKKGLIPPSDFIPLAEETGMIVPIGEWALRTACLQGRQWQREGLPAFRIAVNLSSRQFMSRDFVASVRDTLASTGMDPQRLELEITESMTMDVARSIAILRQLKELGVNISIDDFGTGYSSLSYLKSFPVDCLKIDQSFVRAMLSDTNDRSIVSTIIALAHNLKLRVVAEGVESSEQLDWLAYCGCDELQGYLVGKPMPNEELVRFYRQCS